MRFCLIVGLLWAQVTITESDLPAPGSFYSLGQARPTPSTDYTLTGAGYTWDFSGLRADTHLISEFKRISDVPQYSFSCGNWQFWQSILLKIADSVVNPAFTIRDLYGFLSKTSNWFRVEGVGATVNGLPLTFCYNDPDEIYVLSVDYGDRDSTTFYLRIDFQSPGGGGFPAGTITFAQRGYRIHEVDGYGTVQIPFGTFSCLRLKRKVFQRDTVYFNGMPIQRRDTTYWELEWLAPGQGVPLLQVTGGYVGGSFVAASVRFRDTTAASSLGAEVSPGGPVIGPNPTNGVLQVSTIGASYQLYDIAGRLVQQGVIPSDGRLLLSGSLQNGVYFLRLRQQGREWYRRITLYR